MSVILGRPPEKLKVTVSPGSIFASSIRRADGQSWREGVQLVLDFGTVEWTAQTSGDLALWGESAAEVDAMLATRPRGVKLWYVDGDTRVLWASGSLDRRA